MSDDRQGDSPDGRGGERDPGGDQIALAGAFIDARDWSRALSTAGDVLSAHPDDTRALGVAARACLGLGDYRRSIEFARRAATLDPEDGWALRLLSAAHSHLGETVYARSAATAARNVNPWDWQAHLQLANVDLEAKQVGYETRGAAHEAVRLAPGEPETHVVVGNIALHDKQWKDAAAAYEEALRIDPQHPTARNNLALVSLRRGNAAHAGAAFLDLLAQNPQSRLALYNLRVAVGAGLRRAHVTLYAVMVLVYLTSRGVLSGGQPSVPTRPILIGAAVAAVVIVTLFVLWMRRLAGSRFALLAKAAPQVDRLLLAWMALLAVCALDMVIAATVDPAVSVGFYGTNALLIIASLFVVRARARRLRVERTFL